MEYEPRKKGPEHTETAEESSSLPAEFLALVGSQDAEAIRQAVATIRKEVTEAPVVGRSLAAIKGKEFVIEIKNNSNSNGYVQSVQLDSQQLHSPFIPLERIKSGGKLVLLMGNQPVDVY